MDRKWIVATSLCVVALMADRVAAQTPPPPVPVPAGKAKASESYDELFARYLQSARAAKPVGQDFGWMASLATDVRARRVNDLVTIRVIESIAGVGSADSSLDKSSQAAAAVTQVFGAETKTPSWLDPSNLVGAAADTEFKGGGATSRKGELSAIVTARVVEVLPNGDLVLEGAREIDINGDRQIVVLTGVLRTADVMPGNVALSTSVGHLRIRYFGNGLIKDNLRPGWLIRIVNKIF
jgi:flagellar L-ring protein precursor FlgH